MLNELFEFWNDLIVATILIVLTSVIHAAGLDLIMARIEGRIQKAAGTTLRHHIRKIKVNVQSILGVFLLVTIHIWIWAFTFELLGIKEFKTLEDAVYFSTVTFTTLGYGDLVLRDDWRVLSGIEAANGIIILGWSTAFLFDIMTQLYPRRRARF